MINYWRFDNSPRRRAACASRASRGCPPAKRTRSRWARAWTAPGRRRGPSAPTPGERGRGGAPTGPGGCASNCSRGASRSPEGLRGHDQVAGDPEGSAQAHRPAPGPRTLRHRRASLEHAVRRARAAALHGRDRQAPPAPRQLSARREPPRRRERRAAPPRRSPSPSSRADERPAASTELAAARRYARSMRSTRHGPPSRPPAGRALRPRRASPPTATSGPSTGRALAGACAHQGPRTRPQPLGRHAQNVRVRSDKKLRVNIFKGRAVEIVGLPSGYGRYRWVVESDLSTVDPFRVAAFFVHGDRAEQDIEFSRWGDPLLPRRNMGGVAQELGWASTSSLSAPWPRLHHLVDRKVGMTQFAVRDRPARACWTRRPPPPATAAT